MHISDSRLQALSEILRDIAQVLFAALVLEPFVNGRSNLLLLMFGVVTSAPLWIISLYILH